MPRTHNWLILVAVGVVLMGADAAAWAAPHSETIQGTVLTAGNAQLTLRRFDSPSVVRLTVASEALISRDGRHVPLEQILREDFAVVTVSGSESSPVAIVIVAISPFKQRSCDLFASAAELCRLRDER